MYDSRYWGDSTRAGMSRRVVDYDKYEGGIRDAYRGGPNPMHRHHQDHQDFKQWGQGNIDQKPTVPGYDNAHISQSFMSRHSQSAHIARSTAFSAQHNVAGLPARSHLEFRDYSEHPYVFSAPRVWARLTPETRDKTNVSTGYFGVYASLPDHVPSHYQTPTRHREIRFRDKNLMGYPAAPIGGPTEARQEIHTSPVINELRDRRQLNRVDLNSFRHDDGGGWIQY